MLVAGAPRVAVAASFDPQPWLEDLQEVRAALSEKYANLEWQVFERDTDLTTLFARAETALHQARNVGDARAVFETLTRRLADGHVQVRWPRGDDASGGPVSPAVPGQAPQQGLAEVCLSLGYDASISGHPLFARLPGYRPLPDERALEVPAGLASVAGRQVGVLRVGLFSPYGYPQLCESLLSQQATVPDLRCDSSCSERLEALGYQRLTQELMGRVREVRERGATVLLIDLTGNGGGSEWAEAVARIVSPIRLRSERLGFVRGRHWVDHWSSLAKELRRAAEDSSQDRGQLLRWAVQADEAREVAATPCPSESLWSGRRSSCSWLGQAFYATGILAEGDVAVLRKKPWGPRVFSPAEFDFEESLWRGPLVVLIDEGTGSAAAEFAAVLQDNKAAVLLGAPAAGGCGHTDGGTPTRLTHTGGTLEVPDCARFRVDGANEMMGIDPDVLIGFRRTDGERRKALRAVAALPQGIEMALRQCARSSCRRGGVHSITDR
jgi:hypothetical protein